MGSPLRANNSGLVPLSTHLEFDIKGILSLSPRLALVMAQHTLDRLIQMEAPESAFRKLLAECFLEMPELKAAWIVQAQAGDLFKLAVDCATHTSDQSLRRQVILVAERFRDYKLLRESARRLEKRPLSQQEFKAIAENMHPMSRDFAESTGMMCVDALKTYGLEFRNELKEILKKKPTQFEEIESEEVEVALV